MKNRQKYKNMEIPLKRKEKYRKRHEIIKI